MNISILINFPEPLQVVVFALDRDRLTKEKTFYGHAGTVDQLTWHSSNPELVATASGDKTGEKHKKKPISFLKNSRLLF